MDTKASVNLALSVFADHVLKMMVTVSWPSSTIQIFSEYFQYFWFGEGAIFVFFTSFNVTSFISSFQGRVKYQISNDLKL